MTVSPGIYAAKIVGYGMRATKKGDVSPTIKFEVEDNGQVQFVYWQKNFSTPKLIDQVIKELVICGLRSAADFPSLADGLGAGQGALKGGLQGAAAPDTFLIERF